MKRCLIIFAKEPEKGKVKTRLLPYLSRTFLRDEVLRKSRKVRDLSESYCVNLYKVFLKDTIELAKNIQCEIKILAYESGNKNPKYLKKIAHPFKFYKQKGKNLGQRMHNAFKFAIDNGASRMVIIGSDSPNLPPSFIEDAFRKLQRSDIVLGPSLDCGYYLIGLRKPYLALFKGIKWSTNRVFSDTVKNVQTLKKRIAKLDKWYDVDDLKYFVRLRCDLQKEKNKNIAKWTRRFLKI
jgi:hypothetical protein